MECKLQIFMFALCCAFFANLNLNLRVTSNFEMAHETPFSEKKLGADIEDNWRENSDGLRVS